MVRELTNNVYIDDFLSGADTEEEVENMITLASEIMNKGGFSFNKWGSNSVSVPQADVIGFNNDSTEIFLTLKILGMLWDTCEEAFYFKADSMILDGLQYNKCLVLSFVAQIYDPMGFLNPFTIVLKIMFQDLWRLGLRWNDPLPLKYQNQM